MITVTETGLAMTLAGGHSRHVKTGLDKSGNSRKNYAISASAGF
jgi:hypothetical protein